MKTELFRIPAPHPGRLAIAPRPRGNDWLDDEIAGWHGTGIDIVVSLLTPDEVEEFGLEGESAACDSHAMRFVNFPISDRGTPASRERFGQLIADIGTDLAAGRGVVIHCRQGIGRAGMTAAAVLVANDMEPEQATAIVSKARGRPVPETPAQRDWLDAFATTVIAEHESV
jgi:hypothetical protein